MSVEYLLLLVVIMVVFGYMITNFIGPSIDASNDISDVSAASNAVNSIANAANIVYTNGPNSKRTLTIYIPNDNMTVITGRNGSVGFVSMNVTLADGTIKTVSAKTDYPLFSHTYTLSKGARGAVIKWYNGDAAINEWIG
ncbi:hypothetical protein [Methanobacterium sp.]|uniref:hypothetical protein n=1 Tax=Methanobacterium sp. TaxID=2164 RepID=UPI003C71123B